MPVLWKPVPQGRNPVADASSLGARVRALRQERGLTLKDLGRSAGLSHPFLSQLERGLARPSVGSAERIAEALDVPVGALWAAPRATEAVLVRAHEGTMEGALRVLTAGAEPLHAGEWSGGADWPARRMRRAGAVLVYVVSGDLELDLDGTVHALGEADALLFDGATPHRLRHTGDAGTRALYVAPEG